MAMVLSSVDDELVLGLRRTLSCSSCMTCQHSGRCRTHVSFKQWHAQYHTTSNLYVLP
jgi:hypothetical protein